MNDKSKIADNASLKEIDNAFKIAKTISKVPLIKHIMPRIHNALSEFLEGEPQFSKLKETPDNFNKIFSKLGWVAYESISLDIMATAVDLYAARGKEVAENYLADTYDKDTIRRGLMSFSGHKHFKKRLRLLKLAEIDYLEGRYHACVPLLLSLLDGVVDDISGHIGFFAKGSNLEIRDSIAAHETGLTVLAKIMTKSAKKTNERPCNIPYRHGILHGKELAFDNKIVAAKCWAAFFATRNWAESYDKLKDEPEVKEEYGLKEHLAHRVAMKKLNDAIAAWRPRNMADLDYLPSCGGSDSLPENTPEHAVAKLLEYWQKQSFQLICNMLVYPKKAVQAKNEYGGNAPISFKVLSVEDTAPVVTKVEVELSFQKENRTINEKVSIITNYLDSDGNTLIRSDPNGKWKVMEASLARVASLYQSF